MDDVKRRAAEITGLMDPVDQEKYRTLIKEGYPGVTEEVYFLQMDNADAYVKIGYSNNINGRVADLQVSSPYDIVLVDRLPGDRELERNLHRRFARYRVRGEWFRPSQEIFDFLKQTRQSRVDSLWI